MKNYDLLKVVATKMNGLPYLSEDTVMKDIRAYCKENGIVVCYGQSDDLMELDGAIYDEYDCYDGGTICIDENGDKADANIYYPITAVWAKDNISWQYEFEPKHEVFIIYEDGDIYCKGIVFFVDDLKRNAENETDLQVKVLELALSKAVEMAYEWRSQIDTLSCSSCPLFDYGIFDTCKDSDEGLYHDCANRWKQELIRQAQEEIQRER